MGGRDEGFGLVGQGGCDFFFFGGGRVGGSGWGVRVDVTGK